MVKLGYFNILSLLLRPRSRYHLLSDVHPPMSMTTENVMVPFDR